MAHDIRQSLNILGTQAAVSESTDYNYTTPEEALILNRERYNARVTELLGPTLTHATAEIYERPGNRFEQAVGDFYADPGNQALVAPVIAAFEDVMPGLPFIDLIPDPPEELPGTSATGQASEKMRRIVGAVDMAVAVYNLPSLAKKGIGRIATNIKRPKNYALSDILVDAGYYKTKMKSNTAGTDIVNAMERTGQGQLKTLGKMIKAVATDKPTYGGGMVGEKSVSQLLMREPLYRKQFGLKPRALEELMPKGSLKGTKWEGFVDSNVYITNPDGTLRFNPESEIGQAALQEIATPGKVGKTYGTALHRALGEYLRTPLVKGAEYDPAVHRVNPYRKSYGKAELRDTKSEEQNLRLLKAIYGPDAKVTRDAQTRFHMRYGGMPDNALEEIDRIFYNDVWNFKLNADETKYVKGYFDEIREILTDSGFKEMWGHDRKMPLVDRLKTLKGFFTEPDMKDYHGEKTSQMMRQFMDKLIDHVEVKGTVKYESGRRVHPSQLGRKLVNVEDEDLMWKELIGDYLNVQR